MSGERVDLKTDDGVLDLHVFSPETGAGPWPAVVLYMDGFGVRPELAGMAQRLASEGYVVALPNLYYRTPFAPFAPNVVATEGPERERFKGMIASINHAMVMRDTRARDRVPRSASVRATRRHGRPGLLHGWWLRARAPRERFPIASSWRRRSTAVRSRPTSPTARIGWPGRCERVSTSARPRSMPAFRPNSRLG